MNAFLRRLALPALAWSVLSALCGTLAWSVLSAIVAFAEYPRPASAIVGLWAGVLFGGFIALVAVLPYWALFIAWGAFVTRNPALEANAKHVIRAAFAMAVPLAIVVFFSFLDPGNPNGPFWHEALVGGPMTLLSTWVGILLPRITVRSLQPPNLWVAA